MYNSTYQSLNSKMLFPGEKNMQTMQFPGEACVILPVYRQMKLTYGTEVNTKEELKTFQRESYAAALALNIGKRNVYEILDALAEDVEYCTTAAELIDKMKEYTTIKEQKIMNMLRLFWNENYTRNIHMWKHAIFYACATKTEHINSEFIAMYRFGPVQKVHEHYGSIVKDITEVNCRVCAKEGEDANYLCGGCKIVSYCCKEHQVGDWKNHRTACRTLRKHLVEELN